MRVHLHQAVHLGEAGADALCELAEVNRRRIVTRAWSPWSGGALHHLPPPSDAGAQVKPPQFSELRQDPQNTRPQHLGHLNSRLSLKAPAVMTKLLVPFFPNI